MGKGFHNFMSKKDFHPSAIWNLKKVWMAQQKESEDKTKQEAMRVQYEKEQELINNKALLGDEKARLGLAFMYDPPTGLRKEEENESELKAEPKFEWQRKYNAPRESWAKGDENVADQPFGIMVRNVRCVKCHKWGHTNTDRECPLFNMSGNYDDPGICNNPSELIKELKKVKEGQEDLNEKKAGRRDRLPTEFLNEHMKTEYGLTLRKNVIGSFRTDEKLAAISRRKDKPDDEPSGSKSPSKAKGDKTEQLPQQMASFLSSLSEKEKAKIFKKFFSQEPGDVDKKKSKRGRKEKRKSGKEVRKRKRSDSSGSSESSEKTTPVRRETPEDKSGQRGRYKSPGNSRRRSDSSREEKKRRNVDTREKRRRRSVSLSLSPEDSSRRGRTDARRRHHHH